NYQPNSIGPDDAKQIRFGGIEHRLSQAVLARQSGCDDDSRTTTFFSKRCYDARHRFRRCHDYSKVRNAGKLFCPTIALVFGDPPVLRVDWPDVAFEAISNDVLYYYAADGSLAFGSAE